MNFTREPLIETVITPKEGYKLIVRNSKVGGQEEYFVDAVEVISFGNASFFRSMEKPKCFLVPVTDFEILETRESRMVLKTPSAEKGIKIAGGREAPLKVKEETPSQESEMLPPIVPGEQRSDKRRERRKSRKRRKEDFAENSEEIVAREETKAEEKRPERPGLIPPPSTLISETLVRYKSLAPVEGPPPDIKEPPMPIIPPPSKILRHDEEEANEEETPF